MRRVDDKVVVVVYRWEGDRVLVITAYLSSKIRKYLG